MAEPIVAARVRAGDEHKCGGIIREARGQYGRFLGCSDVQCQQTWDAHGWRFTGRRELYDHGNYGLPDKFWPVKHPGAWEHHELAVWLGGGRHDFTPEKAPEVVEQRISVWEQLAGLVRREPQIRDIEMAG